MENIVDRHLDKQSYRNVVFSNLAYISVDMSWNYIYVLVDHFNQL